jgi:hypothetical protein
MSFDTVSLEREIERFVGERAVKDMEFVVNELRLAIRYRIRIEAELVFGIWDIMPPSP